jgi:hypothetical protein
MIQILDIVAQESSQKLQFRETNRHVAAPILRWPESRKTQRRHSP